MSDILNDIWPALRGGIWTTVSVTFLAAAWGTVVAVVFGVASLSSNRVVRGFIRVYVEVLRGISVVILVFFVFFALPLFLDFVNYTLMQAAVLALGLNLSAYGTEIVRGAVQAVPRGQTEAAVAINLSTLRRIWSVTLPQAAIIILPPYGNLLIEVLKASALVSFLGLSEITNRAQNLRNQAGSPDSALIFLTALIIYFVLSQGIAFGMRLLERRFGRGLEVGRMARTVK
jgi:polar amino acid transport system permease protein